MSAVLANCLLFFVQGDLYLWGGVLFIIANVCFGAANVFYNVFLPEITTQDQADKVSSRGFAYGYLGGAIMLALNCLLVLFAPRLGHLLRDGCTTVVAVGWNLVGRLRGHRVCSVEIASEVKTTAAG